MTRILVVRGTRRSVLQGAMGLVVSGFPGQGRMAATPQGRDPVDWSPLEQCLGPRLREVTSPLEACAGSGGTGAEELFELLRNPYFIAEEPSLTQTLAWQGAWKCEASMRVAIASDARDVAAAVAFSRETGVPLVVKGGGHSYFGNSNRAKSLLIWTRAMREIEVHDSFTPRGCPSDMACPAVSVGAGAIWGEVYQAVAVQSGRYVQGGGCLTVGVAGFVQGGGFSSFSKKFGTGASNLLEAEVVTADGAIRIANAATNSDLFFALRGGGGGTFGIVTRMTLRTHELPERVGSIRMRIRARNDRAWRSLVQEVLDFYRQHLLNSSWGEQISFEPGRVLTVGMLCHGLSQDAVSEIWAPFKAFVDVSPDDLAWELQPEVLSAPGRDFWNAEALRAIPGLIASDDRPGAPPGNIYWKANAAEVGQTLYAYQSMWLSTRLLNEGSRHELGDALVAASSHWPVSLHFNKGLAGAEPDVLTEFAKTSSNPDVADAFALLICAAHGQPAWPGIPGHEPETGTGNAQARLVSLAMQQIRPLDPLAGAYPSEADYFDADWQHRYWGANYRRLQAVKRAVDPSDLFNGHHTVSTGATA